MTRGSSDKTDGLCNVPRHMLQVQIQVGAPLVYTCDVGKDREGTTFGMTHHITVSQPVTLHLLWACYSKTESVRCLMSARL